MMQSIQGHFEAPRGRIALVASRFNDMIVDQLIEGAKDILIRHGVSESDIELIRVPGAFEIPLAAKVAAKTNRYDGIIALGAVIRGATSHYDVVASSSANGLMSASMESNVPMTLGILTTDTLEQAIERAGTKAGNKGADAALSLLELISVVSKLND